MYVCLMNILKIELILCFILLQERVERKVDESYYVIENRIQKLDEVILEERVKIVDIEYVSFVYLYQVIINFYI